MGKFITRFSEYLIKENADSEMGSESSKDYYNDSPETYIHTVLIKLKHNVELIFKNLFEKEEDNIYSNFFIGTSEIDETSGTHKYFEIELHDKENEDHYNLSFMVKLDETVDLMVDKEMDANLIENVYINFKKYNSESDLVSDINRKNNIDKIDHDYILQLFSELDEESLETSEDEDLGLEFNEE